MPENPKVKTGYFRRCRRFIVYCLKLVYVHQTVQTCGGLDDGLKFYWTKKTTQAAKKNIFGASYRCMILNILSQYTYNTV